MLRNIQKCDTFLAIIFSESLNLNSSFEKYEVHDDIQSPVVDSLLGNIDDFRTQTTIQGSQKN